MITELKGQYKQVDLLNAFSVRRSSYDYHRSKISTPNKERIRLRNKVIQIHSASRGAAGSRTITAKLKQDNESVGRYKVTRLMREAKIQSKQPNKPHRYKVAGKPSRIADNHLNREYTVELPNQVWCGDVTFIWCGTTWLYLALVIDLYARRIIGWACSDSPDARLTKKALRLAVESRNCSKALMFHSDQGCHYTSKEFQHELARHDIKQSMSRRGNCWDNVVMERTFRSLKTEWIPKKFYSSYNEAEYDVLQYIKYYNGERCHSYNNYLNPIDAEAAVA